MSRFIAVDRQTTYLLPPSVDEWLPANHLARFVVEVIEQLDLSALTRQYGGRGSAAHHPAVRRAKRMFRPALHALGVRDRQAENLLK